MKEKGKKIVRARQFTYVQDISHLKVKPEEFQHLLSKSGAAEWAYILHDKDTDKNNTIRDHYHVVLKYANPQTLSKIANIFRDKQQYVQIWNGRIDNAYSYLIHETSDAQTKHRYSPKEVVASFNFVKKIEKIRISIKGKSSLKDDIEEKLKDYAENIISLHELRESIGDYAFTTPKLQRHIKEIKKLHDEDNHLKWLRSFKGKKMKVIWLYGEGGTGKTRCARAMTKDDDVVVLGSSNDYFQAYDGQRVIIINDLRPSDFKFGDLLKLLDPYEHSKEAPRRYRNAKLNLEKVIITTPYSPISFYNHCFIEDKKIDKVNQLTRRIAQTIEVTKEFTEKFLKEHERDEKSDS